MRYRPLGHKKLHGEGLGFWDPLYSLTQLNTAQAMFDTAFLWGRGITWVKPSIHAEAGPVRTQFLIKFSLSNRPDEHYSYSIYPSLREETWHSLHFCRWRK